MTSTTGVKQPSGLILWLLLWFAGLYLRLTLLVAPPLGPTIASDLSLGVAGMGALTTLPVLLLALAAIMGAWVVARFGPVRTVAVCLLVIALGSAARASASAPTLLFLTTGIMGLGIAALQPALPALVRLWSPTRIALATAVYMNGMLMGEMLAAGFTLPVIMPLTGYSWRWSLLIWSLPGLLVAAGIWYWRPVQVPRSDTEEAEPIHWKPDFRDPVVWQVGGVLACSSALFFGINAYMAPVLAGRGEADSLSLGLFFFNLAQIGASLITLRYARRWLGRLLPMVLTTAICLMGTLLFGWTSGWLAIAGAFSVSLAAGILLVLMVSMPGAMSSVSGTAPMAAGMFTVGYALGFLLPQLGGLLVDATGNASLALVPLVCSAFVALPLTHRLALAYRRRAL